MQTELGRLNELCKLNFAVELCRQNFQAELCRLNFAVELCRLNLQANCVNFATVGKYYHVHIPNLTKPEVQAKMKP